MQNAVRTKRRSFPPPHASPPAFASLAFAAVTVFARAATHVQLHVRRRDASLLVYFAGATFIFAAICSPSSRRPLARRLHRVDQRTPQARRFRAYAIRRSPFRPRLVTMSLSRPGCSPVSSRSFADPYTVCAASKSAVSRCNPTLHAAIRQRLDHQHYVRRPAS